MEKPRKRGPDDIAPELARLREAIDEVDRAILARLNDRAALVQQVGTLKAGGQRAPVYVAGRERNLIAALTRANAGPFPDAAIAHVFREIISATRSLEEHTRVAYLGPEGSFSHLAALQQFGAQVDLAPADSIAEVFALTERGKVHYGIVPVENSTEGAVAASFDCLIGSEVTICGEVVVAVVQHLLSKSGEIGDVRRVASHPQGLAQCRTWLERNLPGIDQVETPSTSQAAKLAAESPDIAAISSEAAAAAYGLQVIESGIEDTRGNSTRFVVVGTDAPGASGNDLTSAVFTTHKDQSGALYRLLEPFDAHGVNLTTIQSRPMKGKPWEYLFFIDMEGHISESAVADALREAALRSHSHKILGSYPRALTRTDDAIGARL